MTNKLDDLLHTLKTTPPPAGEENNLAKKACINKALKEFDKINKKTAKESPKRPRPTSTAFAGFNQWIRSVTMKKAYILAGGTCLGVLAFGLVQRQPQIFLPPEVEAIGTRAQAGNMSTQDDMITAEAEPSTPLITVAKNVPQSPPAELKGNASDPLDAALKSAPNHTSGKQHAQQRSAEATYSPGTIMGQAASVNIAASGQMVPQSIIPSYPTPDSIPPIAEQGRDQFDGKKANPVKSVSTEPVSTFSIDVDTASYSFMRSSLNNGKIPRPEQVRVEELINYFPYDYEPAASKERPFKANVSVFPAPWNKHTKLMHIGIKGYELKQAEKPRSNLVFLIDTSGSMNQQNKLPLLINSFKLMLNKLQPEDTISIVTYAGSAGTALEPTQVKDKATIIQALENLRAGGATAGASGIQQAYALAERNKLEKGINRVILATDGDFNVGITDQEQLKSYIEKKRESGVFLSTIGFGRGNYNDALMQTLAQHGNGNAAYIDTLSEAQKVLVEEAGSTIFPIAKDVKIQVEFNPAKIAEYRLIGYETRRLNREDFNNDKVDAGDIGAGHTVTAIYEITPVGSEAQMMDELRYAENQPMQAAKQTPIDNNEYAFVKMRYKLPAESKSQLITTPVGKAAEFETLADTPTDVRFATSVAAFGQKLQHSEYLNDYDYDSILKDATSARGEDPFGYRSEFIHLIRLTQQLDP